jgi:hypothetical protein
VRIRVKVAAHPEHEKNTYYICRDDLQAK